MKTKRRTEIMMETHEITIISFGQRQAATPFCQACQAHVLHLTIAQATSVLPLSEAEINRLVENKQIHLTENADSKLLLCGNSLSALTKSN